MKSFLIDTNVIIRLLIQDDPSQFTKAQELFENIENGQAKGYISLLVLHEVLWILERFYLLKKITFVPQVQSLLSLKHLDILETKKQLVMASLTLMQKKNVDFTDAYLFLAKNKKTIFSFDQDFKKLDR